MHIKLFFIILTAVLPAMTLRGASPNDSLLGALDKAIASKELFAAERKTKITKALGDLSSAREDKDLYNVYRTLYSLYRSFRGDSAMWVAEKRLEAAGRLADRTRLTSATLNLAESYSLAGDYYRAIEILDTLDRNVMKPYHLKYLYIVYRNTYSRMAKADGVQSHRITFEEKTRAYRDSVMSMVPDTDAEYLYLKAWQLMGLGRWTEALETIRKNERRHGRSTKSSQMTQLAEIYHNLHDTDAEICCLAEAAAIDLEGGIRDYSALMELAKRLNEEGDVERAYRYIRCALEDAYFCNAKSRTAEILELIPIIDTAYHENEQKRIVALWWLFGVISLLALAVLAALWVARRRLKANRAISRSLNERNAELSAINRQLEDSNRMREQYISDLFDAHSGYINRMGQFRKSILRLMKAAQYKEALELVKSAKADNAELKELYSRFDSIFLSLYPRFIADFNEMVAEDNRVDPNAGSLTSELRVLALMRIGITSSARIADLLHYSPQTVYNYKFAIRNALVIPKEEFDKKLIKMGV